MRFLCRLGWSACRLLVVAICEVGCTQADDEAKAQRDYDRTHWSVTFAEPMLDGRDNRAELGDWEVREHNEKCVPLLEDFGMGAVDKCSGYLEKLYHYHAKRAGLPYRSLSQDVSPKYSPGLLPPPPPMMPMSTDCMPNALGGGFNCTSY